MQCSQNATCCLACAEGFGGCNCDTITNFDVFCEGSDYEGCQCKPFDNPKTCPAPSKKSDDHSVAATAGMLAVPEGYSMLAVELVDPRQGILMPNNTFMQWWLFANGPVAITVSIGQTFDPTQAHRAPGYQVCSDCNGETNHVVTVMGWAHIGRFPVWIIQNSWGTNTSDDGFFYIRFQDVGTRAGHFRMATPTGIMVALHNKTITQTSLPRKWVPPAQFNLASQGKFGNHKATCVPPVLNQQYCGSCYAFGTSTVFGVTLCRVTKDEKFVFYSPQATLGIVYEETQTDPCDGGEPYETMWALTTRINSSRFATCGAACTDGCLPYTEGNCMESSGPLGAIAHQPSSTSHAEGKQRAQHRDIVHRVVTAAGHIKTNKDRRQSGTNIVPGRRHEVDLHSSRANWVLRHFTESWLRKLGEPHRHRMHQVYSMTSQIANGLIHRVRLAMAVGKTTYHVHATMRYGEHPESRAVEWSMLQYSTDMPKAFFRKDSM